VKQTIPCVSRKLCHPRLQECQLDCLIWEVACRILGVSMKTLAMFHISHRWSLQIPRLITANYHNFLDYQPDDILPQTYKEIIAICRSIAVRYLWIDSLCIIQDYGGLEFRKKAPLMTDIYQYAFLTLTILWDFPGLSVFRKCRPRSIPRHKPAASYNQQDSTCQTDEYVFVEHRDALDLQVAVDLAPLNKRAWVLQERCLSRRLLYLGNEQVFESVMNVLAVRYLQLCNILHPEGPTQSVTLWLTYQDLIETPIGVGSFRDILDTI
jgi:hypothetical protein